MTIRDLIESVSGIDPDGEALVVLFKNDGTSEQFEIDAVTHIDGVARIEISEGNRCNRSRSFSERKETGMLSLV